MQSNMEIYNLHANIFKKNPESCFIKCGTFHSLRSHEKQDFLSMTTALCSIFAVKQSLCYNNPKNFLIGNPTFSHVSMGLTEKMSSESLPMQIKNLPPATRQSDLDTGKMNNS